MADFSFCAFPRSRIAIGLLALFGMVALRGSEATPLAAKPARVEHRSFLYAGEWDTRKELQSIFLVRDGRVTWSYTMPLKTKEGRFQEFDDVTLLPDGTILFSRMTGAGLVTPEKKLLWNYEAPVGTEVHSVQALDHGRVLMMRNGDPAVALIIELATGKVDKEIPIPTSITGTHGQFRHIRMTPAGTLLVPHLSEKKVVEYDLEGHVLWSVEAVSPWHAVRLKNGNTLIAGDWSAYVREVNPKGETVWEVTQADLPRIRLYNTQTANRLANGNTLICNWVGGNNNKDQWPGSVQVFEVTPGKEVVWILSEWNDPDLGTATCIQLLDADGRPSPDDVQR